MGVSVSWRHASPLGLLLLALAVFGAGALASDASAARKPTSVQLVTRDAIVASGRTFDLELRCPGSARACEGKVTVRELRPVVRPAGATPRKKRRRLVLARGEAALEGGAVTTVSLQLTKKGFKRIRRHGPFVARVVMGGRDATGRRVRLKRKIRIGVPVREKPSLLVGIADDRIQGAPVETSRIMRDLGARGVRVLLLWTPGQSALVPAQIATLTGVVAAATDLRVVLTGRSRTGSEAPKTAGARASYCSFLADAAARFPQISDFSVWQEPNKQQFWSPQYGADGRSLAPAAYASLLAQCWDSLHAIRPDVNVIGPATASKGNDRPTARSNISHAPGTFIRRMGTAYRASGRAAPLFDTVSHHPYGTHSAERPWARHARSRTLGMGDWKGLLQALHDAFAGTAQPLPGAGGVQIWYLENGFQTVPTAARRAQYTGVENDAHALLDYSPEGDPDPSALEAPDQATQLRDAIHLAYCQPYVSAFFNFLLYDETRLGRWQSGLLWTDGAPKASATAFREAATAAAARQIRCSSLRGGPVKRAFVPKTKVGVTRLGWSRATRFNHKHDLWRLQVQVDEPSTYVATIVPVKRRGTSARAVGEAEQTTSGALRKGFYQWVKFPRQRLEPGLYRIEVAVTSTVSPTRTATLDGPVFEVRERRR